MPSFKLAIFLFFSLCSAGGFAQSKKSAVVCNDDCCKKAPATKISMTKPVSEMETTVSAKAITCKLTSPEMRKRKTEVLASLKSKILDKHELNDGYKYTFAGNDGVLDEVISFIKTERLCCDFFTFNISVSDVEGHIWLSITGPKGAKDFIKTEMDL